MTADASRIALVLAAHGDRGGSDRNAVLRLHANMLLKRGLFKTVSFGVLNGEPALVDALRETERCDADRIIVYPFFMSGGYFAKEALPRRVGEAGLKIPIQMPEPLGLDPALPRLLLQSSIGAAQKAGFEPSEARLLIAGHGSKSGWASAQATEAIAAAVRHQASFKKVTTGFLEEPPFLADALRAEHLLTVIAGFFSGEGMHGHDDVPKAIASVSTPCAYTRPIGCDPGIAKLIEHAVLRSLTHRSA